MGEKEEFNTLTFEKRLMQLKDTQESIQALSSWCLKQRIHHKKIVSSWLNVLKRVKVEQRLVLFYLANDVIQYSKRKKYEFVESWGLNLQKATPLVRDEKVRPKILRIFKIWEQRAVYDDEFLTDLTGLLSAGATKKTDDDPLDFQPQQLVNKIKQCAVLEADTKVRLSNIHNHHLDLSDADELRANLKDRRNQVDVEKELNEGILCVEKYTQALQREIVAREALLALLTSASLYYSTQRGEVKVVAYAYKNFGSRVRALKRKLDELIPTLPSSAPSPPQHDDDVPSPGPDEDLDLPSTERVDENDVSYNIDQTFSTSISADGSLYNLGLSSFLSTENPLTIFNDSMVDLDGSAEKKVVNTKGGDDTKPVKEWSSEVVIVDSASPDNDSAGSVTSQKSMETLPGLDLLIPDGNLPPISFYGSLNSSNVATEAPYTPEPVPSPWVSASAAAAATPVTAATFAAAATPIDVRPTWPPPPAPPQIPPQSKVRNVFAEPPESPPLAQRVSASVLAPRTDARTEVPAVDVDHRGLLPPPPPPPILPLLGQCEDVDHRVLGSTSVPTSLRHNQHQDIDHRNLISLTQQLPSDQQPHASHAIMDQDYRVAPMIPPTDIVESVDMDLSEDEEQGMYQAPSNRAERRNSFNNNKVLVGGDDNDNTEIMNVIHNDRHEASHSPSEQIPLSHAGPRFNPNISHMTSRISSTVPHIVTSIPLVISSAGNVPSPSINHSVPVVTRAMPNMPLSTPVAQMPAIITQPGLNMPQSAPLVPPLPNPFDNMPENLKFNFQNYSPNYQNNIYEGKSLEDNYDEDLRNRGVDGVPHIDIRNPSPPNFEEYGENNWSHEGQMTPFVNHRYPRNWAPQNMYRPPFSPQFRPRNGPRPGNRWAGPRGQRFW